MDVDITITMPKYKYDELVSENERLKEYVKNKTENFNIYFKLDTSNRNVTRELSYRYIKQESNIFTESFYKDLDKHLEDFKNGSILHDIAENNRRYNNLLEGQKMKEGCEYMDYSMLMKN